MPPSPLAGRFKMTPRLLLSCIIAVCFLALPAGPAGARDKSRPDGVRLSPLPAALSQTAAAHQPGKTLLTGPAAQRFHKYTNARRPSAMLTGALGPEIKLWYRPLAGTPRHIKGPNAILQKAAVRGKPGRERDEITARQFLHANRALLRIKDPDRELQIHRHQVDGLGRRHLRLAQSFQNIPVWPADLLIHLDPQGNVDMLDGAYVPTPRRLTIRPVITADEAAGLARLETAFPEATILEGPQLIIHAPGDRPARLAWKMTLTSATFSNWLVAIDALTGQTRLVYDTTMTDNVAGAGVDLFGETQSLNVWKEGRTFYLVDTSKPMFDAQNSDPPSPQTTKGAIIVLDAANQPDTSDPQVLPSLKNIPSASATAGWLADGVSAAAALSETYDYYFDRHGRNSIDNQGGSIHAVVRLGNQYENAFWSSELNLMAFGDAQPFAGALDVVAHELTHGVTDSTAKLIYKDQPGALNEAFSDIFGEMVEARTIGTSPDWLMGTKLDEPFRNLADPSSIDISPGFGPYPAKMSDYIQTTQDNGGVHLNSSIINHAYYLLAEGLTGAIGLAAAEDIFYRALNFHLVANSQFIDARLACIAAAEEIFGPASVQAARTAEAFDAVEIFEDAGTPPAPPLPPVNAADSAIFIYKTAQQAYFLGVREEGDPELGLQLSFNSVNPSRPSVAGDGSAAIFVDSSNDICFIDTDGRSAEDCAGLDNVHSVAWSPDKKLYAYVPLEGAEPNRTRANRIVVAEKVNGTAKTYELKAPVIDGVTTNTILYADAMDFSADNRYLIYDALNVMQLTDGSRLGAWSIYALDLKTGQTLALVPPVAGLDIGFPALSQTSDSFITFDALDSQTGRSTIYAGNLLTGELAVVATTDSSYGVPGYTGDDSAIVFSLADFTQTGYSLWQQALTSDHLTPVGDPTLFLSDADFGVIFRRGTFVPPTTDIAVSPAALNFGEIFVSKQASAALTVTNTGTADLQITALAVSGPDAAEFSLKSSCLGQVLTPSAACTVRMTFAPASPALKNATLAVQSDVPATPVVDVPLSGLGLAAGTRGDLNSDAGVDLTDAILALQVLAGLEPALEISSAADLNLDEKIGLAEVIYILQKTGQQ